MAGPQRFIVGIDTQLTRFLAFCAARNSPWQKTRWLFRLLEFSFHGIPWLVMTFIAILYSDDAQRSTFWITMMNALLFDLVAVLILKYIARRPRPPHHDSKDMLMTVKIDQHFSFPSGHTTRAIMCCCLILYLVNLSTSMQLFVIVWSVATSLSRIFLGRHYASDVLAGALVGVIEFYVVTEYLILDKSTCSMVATTLQSTFGLH